MERRIVAQMLTCMDELSFAATGGRPVIVMGATNRPDALDPALRRAGRFDREIALGIPDNAARARILGVLCRRMKIAGDLDLDVLAKRANGFVGADLAALCKEAAVIAVNRIFAEILSAPPPPAEAATADVSMPDAAEQGASEGGEAAEEAAAAAATEQPQPQQPSTRHEEEMGALATAQAASTALRRSTQLTAEQLAPLAVTMADFEAGLKKVQPSAQREGFATVPDVSWADIGAMRELRAELHHAVLAPIKHPERFTALGLQPSCGVLLYGPPGCGKTLLAKAVANESGASFIAVKGPELLNKYVGESERAVRQLFARGRASAPCVVFFDELDALTPKRGGDSTSQATERLVNQMLTEMDGLDEKRSVFVIAATNRPDIIDPAMMRPGRLDKLLYVKLPTADGRADILRAAARRMPLAPDVDLGAIAADARCNGYSGADLAALAREAAVGALRECDDDDGGGGGGDGDEAAAKPKAEGGGDATPMVRARHFDRALDNVLPSVSPKDERSYATMAAKLRRSRASVPAAAEAPEASQSSEKRE